MSVLRSHLGAPARRALLAVLLTLSLVATQLAVLAPPAQADISAGGWTVDRLILEFEDGSRYDTADDGGAALTPERGADWTLWRTPTANIHVSCSQDLRGRQVVDPDGNTRVISDFFLRSINPSGNSPRTCGGPGPQPTVDAACEGFLSDPSLAIDVDLDGALGAELYVDGAYREIVAESGRLIVDWPRSNGTLRDEVRVEVRLGHDADSRLPERRDSATVALSSCPQPQLELDLEKSAAGLDRDAEGRPTVPTVDGVPVEVTYDFTVTNRSETSVTLTSLTDDRFGTIDLGGSITLGVGESTTITRTFVIPVDEFDVDSLHRNVATVVGVDADDPDRRVEAEDDETVSWLPKLDVELDKTNRIAASGDDFAAATQAPRGSDIEFQLAITNTGDVPGRIASLTDQVGDDAPIDLLDGVDLDCGGFAVDTDLIGVGDTVTCTFAISDYASGDFADTVVNVASVTLTDPAGRADDASAQDDSTVTTPDQPILDVAVDKTNDAGGEGFADQGEARSPGDDVTFRVTVTNLETATTSGVVTSLTDTFGDTELDLLDPQVATLDCGPDAISAPLAPGESITCTFTLADYAPDWDGSLTNTVEVVLEDPAGDAETSRDDDDSTVTTPPRPELDVAIVKTNDASGDGTYADRGSAENAGDDVPFRLAITNTSDDTPGVVTSLIDEVDGRDTLDLLAGDVACLDAEGDAFTIGADGDVLDPGASITCDFTVPGYAPAFGDEVVNTATVVLADPEGRAADATASDTSVVETTPRLLVDVVKKNDAGGGFASVGEADRPGQDVTFKVAIHNRGEVPGAITSFSDVVVEGGETVAELDLLTSDAVTCTVDDVGFVLASDLLAPGQTLLCEFVVAGYAPDWGGQVDNTVEVELTDPDERAEPGTNTDDSTVTTPEQPELSVEVGKFNDADGDGIFTNAERASAVGQDVPFQVQVTNTGDVPAELTSVTDTFVDLSGETQEIELLSADLLDCAAFDPATDLLAPNQSILCTFVLDGYAPGFDDQIDNVVEVELSDPTGDADPATGDDDSTVTGPQRPVPSVTLEKSAVDGVGDGNVVTIVDGAPVDVTYRYVVGNDGEEPLTGFVVADDKIDQELVQAAFDAALAEQHGEALPVGDEVVFEVTHTGVTAGDFTDGELTNRATVDAVGVESGDPTDAAADETVFLDEVVTPEPKLVSVDADCFSVEDVPELQVVVDLDGAESVELIVDGESVTITEAETLLPWPTVDGEFVDQVTIEFDGDTTVVDLPDCAVPPVGEPDPELAVDVVKKNDADGDGKFTDAEEAFAPDQDVAFEIAITNRGDVAARIATFSDVVVEGDQELTRLDLLELDGVVCSTTEGAFSLADDLLAPGATLTCEFTVAGYAAGWGGEVTNTVEVELVDPEGDADPVTGDDDSTVVTPQRPELSAEVDKRNRAAGSDAEFADSSVVASRGDVEFQVTVTNTGDVPATVASLTDQVGDRTYDLLSEVDLSCDVGAIGEVVLAADGGTVTCTFTLADYAPQVGDLTNTVTVVLEDPDERAEDSEPVSDTSTVTVPQDACVDLLGKSIDNFRTALGLEGPFSDRGNLLDGLQELQLLLGTFCDVTVHLSVYEIPDGERPTDATFGDQVLFDTDDTTLFPGDTVSGATSGEDGGDTFGEDVIGCG